MSTSRLEVNTTDKKQEKLPKVDHFSFVMEYAKSKLAEPKQFNQIFEITIVNIDLGNFFGKQLGISESNDTFNKKLYKYAFDRTLSLEKKGYLKKIKGNYQFNSDKKTEWQTIFDSDTTNYIKKNTKELFSTDTNQSSEMSHSINSDKEMATATPMEIEPARHESSAPEIKEIEKETQRITELNTESDTFKPVKKASVRVEKKSIDEHVFTERKDFRDLLNEYIKSKTTNAEDVNQVSEIIIVNSDLKDFYLNQLQVHSLKSSQNGKLLHQISHRLNKLAQFGILHKESVPPSFNFIKENFHKWKQVCDKISANYILPISKSENKKRKKYIEDEVQTETTKENIPKLKKQKPNAEIENAAGSDERFETMQVANFDDNEFKNSESTLEASDTESYPYTKLLKFKKLISQRYFIKKDVCEFLKTQREGFEGIRAESFTTTDFRNYLLDTKLGKGQWLLNSKDDYYDECVGVLQEISIILLGKLKTLGKVHNNFLSKKDSVGGNALFVLHSSITENQFNQALKDSPPNQAIKFPRIDSKKMLMEYAKSKLKIKTFEKILKVKISNSELRDFFLKQYESVELDKKQKKSLLTFTLNKLNHLKRKNHLDEENGSFIFNVWDVDQKNMWQTIFDGDTTNYIKSANQSLVLGENNQTIAAVRKHMSPSTKVKDRRLDDLVPNIDKPEVDFAKLLLEYLDTQKINHNSAEQISTIIFTALDVKEFCYKKLNIHKINFRQSHRINNQIINHLNKLAQFSYFQKVDQTYHFPLEKMDELQLLYTTGTIKYKLVFKKNEKKVTNFKKNKTKPTEHINEPESEEKDVIAKSIRKKTENSKIEIATNQSRSLVESMEKDSALSSKKDSDSKLESRIATQNLIQQIDKLWDEQYSTEAKNHRFRVVVEKIEGNPEALQRFQTMEDLADSFDILYLPVKGEQLLNSTKNKTDATINFNTTPWPFTKSVSYGAFTEKTLPHGLPAYLMGTSLIFPLSVEPGSNGYLFPRTETYDSKSEKNAFLEKFYKPLKNSDPTAAAKALLLLFSHTVNQFYYTRSKGKYKINAWIAHIQSVLIKYKFGYLSDAVRKALKNADNKFQAEKKTLTSLESEQKIINEQKSESMELVENNLVSDATNDINKDNIVKKLYVTKKFNVPHKLKINKLNDTTQVIDEDADVYDKESGKFILSIRKNILFNNEETTQAVHELNKYAFMSEKNKIETFGAQRPDDKVQIKNGEKKKIPSSAAIGFVSQKRFPLKPSGFFSSHKYAVPIFGASAKIAKVGEKLYQEVLPEEFAQVAKKLKKYEPFFLPGNEVSFAEVVNVDRQSKSHVDDNQLAGKSCSILTILNGSNMPRFEGGELFLPEYDIALKPKQGDIVLADFSNVHCNTKIEFLDKDPKNIKRISLVFIARGELTKKAYRPSVEDSGDERGKTDFTNKEIDAKELLPEKKPTSTSFTFFKCLQEGEKLFKNKKPKIWADNEAAAEEALNRRNNFQHSKK